MTPAEILRKAAVYITMNGWLQGHLGSCDGPVCLVGAIRVITGGHPGGKLDQLGLFATLAVREFLRCEHIGDWNDTPGRTAQEVIETLHKVADKLEGRT